MSGNQPTSGGGSKKHSGGGKHSGKKGHYPKKHHPHHQHKGHHPNAGKKHTVPWWQKGPWPKGPYKPGYTRGELQCCLAESIAASLVMAGVPVDDRDIVALYLRTARPGDDGADILATLESATRYGLAGVRLADYSPAICLSPGTIYGVTLARGSHMLTVAGGGLVWSWGDLYDAPDLEVVEAWDLRWDL